jgi:subtilase family serine protease
MGARSTQRWARSLAALPLVTVGLAGAALPAQAAVSGSTVLSGTQSPAATRAHFAGALNQAQSVSFELVMALPDAAGAEALATAVSTPGNASYRHYLTAAQWEARFSPSQSAIANAEAWLEHEGLHVGAVPADRMTIPVTGTIAQIDRAFSTTLANYRVGGQTVRLASADLTIPKALADSISGTVGLNQSLATATSTTGAGTAASTGSGNDISQPAAFRNAPPCSTYYGQKVDTTHPAYGNGYPSPLPYQLCGYTPPQMRSAYDIAGEVASGDDGSGVTVAIVDAYTSPTLLSDAQRYFKLNDPTHPLTSSQFSEIVPSSYNEIHACGANGWFGEQSLDLEAVHSMAPGANILYVGGKNCENGLLDSLRTIIDGSLAQVITDSWGDDAGDVVDSASDRAAYDHLFMMADATGISVMFSAGDDGDEYTTVGFVAADYPPSSPYITAVGGTSLQVGSTGARVGELGWSTARSVLCTTDLVGEEPGCSARTLHTWLPTAYDYGGGGGVSVHYAEPAYQVPVVPAALADLNKATTGEANRVVPDISMDADPTTGFLEGETQTFPDGVHYGQYRIGGTSLSSPLFAGVVADADQAAGGSLGFLNPALYSVETHDPSAIYDVVPGGKQALSRVDYLNGVNGTDGLEYSTRILAYEGVETYCTSRKNCQSRNVLLTTTRGYDSMTGLGTAGPGFVHELARI